ncbi:MAG: glycoside hydrolase family 127 protein [Eubacteriales bacterium]|nr:glycoside hydrolase family 127 protein [Eubacteriales bacterium]
MTTDKLHDFQYRQVELLDGPCLSQRQETIELYLRKPSVEDALHEVRLTAGLPTNACGMPGWGPSLGQYFGAYAKLYRCTGDERLYHKCMCLFDGWAECADRCEKVLDLGTYPYEKMIGGLLDMYEYMDVSRARAYIWRLTEHAMAAFDRSIPRDGLQDERMKEQIEWYTLPENLFRAYQLFGDECYRSFANEWLYPYFYHKILQGDDRHIGPRHAYSHVNSLSSAARAYIVSGDEKYLRFLEKAYDIITSRHTYATGGYGPAEMLFGNRPGYMGDMLKTTWDFGHDAIGALYDNFCGNRVSRSDAWGSCEISCCAWAVFKLCGYLLRLTGDARYGAWAEQMLLNGLWGQLPITDKGQVMYYANYFIDGALKTVEDRRLTRDGANHVWQCCTGTFPQDVAEYANMIWYQDAEGIYISQPIASRLSATYEDAELTAEVLSRFPEDEFVLIHIRMGQPRKMKLRVRVPAWATNGNRVSVNGKPVAAACAPENWCEIQRVWSDDMVRVDLPYSLAFKPVDSQNPEIMALTFGPVTLACNEMTLLTGDSAHPEDWIKPVQDAFATFETLPGYAGRQRFITRRFSPYYQFPAMTWYYLYNRVQPDFR